MTQKQPREKTSPTSAKSLNVVFAGTGSYVPPNVVRNEDLAALGCDPDWIIQRTGIQERRKVSPGMSTSDLAYEAALKCLTHADARADQLDLIIVGTVSPDHPTPHAGSMLQTKLGAHCPAMDLNSACSGFVYALITGAHFIHGGHFKNVLVVGADVMSNLVSPNDEKTYPLFGDAAGAILLRDRTKTQQGHQIVTFDLGSEGEHSEHLVIPCGGSTEPITVERAQLGRQFVHMDGKAVFKWAVRKIHDACETILRQAEISKEEIALFIFHQANYRIIEAAVASLEIPPEKCFINLTKYGNSSSGSIPLALDEAVQQNLIRAGDKVVLCGFGGGLSWGACLMQW